MEKAGVLVTEEPAAAQVAELKLPPHGHSGIAPLCSRLHPPLCFPTAPFSYFDCNEALPPLFAGWLWGAAGELGAVALFAVSYAMTTGKEPLWAGLSERDTSPRPAQQPCTKPWPEFSSRGASRNGLIKKETAGFNFINTIIWLRGHSKGFEAISRQRRRWGGWIRLVTGGTPAPVSTTAGTRRHKSSFFPRSIQGFC